MAQLQTQPQRAHQTSQGNLCDELGEYKTAQRHKETMSAGQLRILLVGNGGREHTLAWKLAQSPKVETIHVVPGNGGTAG